MEGIFIVFFSLTILISCNTTEKYYDNGTLKEIGKTSNGLKTGEWKFYHENGVLFQVGKYYEDKEVGKWELYHKNERLWQVGKFNEGKQTGEWLFFHSNGNSEGVGTLLNGAKVGIWKWNHTNGKIYTERLWENGKLKQIISCFDGEGNELDKGSLISGSGTLNLFDIDGNQLETIRYENGEFVK